MDDFPQFETGVGIKPDSLPGLILKERFWLALLAVLVSFFILLYIRFAFLVGFDHDEVEHAHVAFRILSGELPYRDFYQNHWPTYWLLVVQFVKAFPFSTGAILAGRAASLLALAACWLLGLRLLRQIPGGLSGLAVLVYSTAVILIAFPVEFYIARPEPMMTLFSTAGLCLIPACGKLRHGRALGLGILFGLALSVSMKVMPLVLVVPLLIFYHAVRDRSVKPVLALVAYGFGTALALLPTAWWLIHHNLLEAFYFDVFELNMAVSKPWYQSFKFLSLAIYLPAVLGVLAWLWTRWCGTVKNENGCMVVVLSLLCGLLLAFIARHPGVYNMQALTIPIAIGFAGLASFLWMHGRNLGYRLLIIASLLAYPVTQASTQLALFKGNFKMPHGELQAVMNLARPGGRSCIAFSSVHPVFCHSVSNLSNGWDLTFAQEIDDPQQFARFQQIWSEGISLAIKMRPDIILRRTPKSRWEGALAIGLISQQELDGLDNLLQFYEVRMIGGHEFWLRKSVELNKTQIQTD